MCRNDWHQGDMTGQEPRAGTALTLYAPQPCQLKLSSPLPVRRLRTSFATECHGWRQGYFSGTQIPTVSVEDGRKECKLFDCCVIKLFINEIWEQAESSFLKNANNSIRNREKCTGRENRGAARLLIGMDGALSRLPKDAGC